MDNEPSTSNVSDDTRQYASLLISISNYVGTATLAILAGLVAIFTFVEQTSKPHWYFYLVVVLGVFCLVWSFIDGGRASSSVAKAVGDKTWQANSKPNQGSFDRQATTTLMGLILVLAAATIGTLH